MNIQKTKSSNQNPMESQMKIQSEQFDSFKLSELFQEAKYLINKISSSPILAERAQYTQNRIKLIAQFTVRKLKAKGNMETKRFIGLLSIFSFVMTATENSQSSLNFPMIFYRNIHKYTEAVVSLDSEINQKKIESDKKKLVTTFLYSLVSLCQNKGNLGNLDLKKLFSMGVVKNLLKLQIEDDERSMRLYRVLILYIHQNKSRKVFNPYLLKSLLYHIMNCNSNKNTQVLILYLLCHVLKNKKIILNSSDSAGLSQRMVELITEKNATIQVARLGFSVLSKLIDKDSRISINLLTVDNLIYLINRFYSQEPDTYRLNPSLILILTNLTSQESLLIYQNLVVNQKPTNISLEVLECLTRKANKDLLQDLVFSNFGQKLLQYLDGQATQYQKQFVGRIMKNAVESNMKESRLIAEALKRLVLWRQQSFASRLSPVIKFTDLY